MATSRQMRMDDLGMSVLSGADPGDLTAMTTHCDGNAGGLRCRRWFAYRRPKSSATTLQPSSLAHREDRIASNVISILSIGTPKPVASALNSVRFIECRWVSKISKSFVRRTKTLSNTKKATASCVCCLSIATISDGGGFWSSFIRFIT